MWPGVCRRLFLISFIIPFTTTNSEQAMTTDYFQDYIESGANVEII
jgi:hypothetical protein